MMGSGESLLGQRWTRDQKVASLRSNRNGERISSPELTLCADSYSVCVPIRVPAVAHKRSRSFCQTCRWQVTPKHAYTLDPTKSEWVNYAVQA